MQIITADGDRFVVYVWDSWEAAVKLVTETSKVQISSLSQDLTALA